MKSASTIEFEPSAHLAFSLAEERRDYFTVALLYRALVRVIPYKIWSLLTPEERDRIGPMTQNIAYKAVASKLSESEEGTGGS